MGENTDLSVSGPYQYPGDLHPSFRIDGPDGIIASVYAPDGDEDKAERLALRIAAAIRQEEVNG